MTRVLDALASPLPGEIRLLLARQVEGRVRVLRFLDDRDDLSVRLAEEAGWPMSRIEIVVELGAFYQIVIGPLQSTTREDIPAGLVSRVPVLCGTQTRFDQESSSLIRRAVRDFFSIAQQIRVPFSWLRTGDPEDLVWRIAHSETPDGT